uniref:GAG-pre-integrase domain-containing protein n=1 Tax=Aegilops tauschii subsp. strangulata TaxID=200361 RepID=A0A453EBU1_AEGTS
MRHSRLIINPRHGTRRSFTPPSTISPSTAAAAGMTGSLTPVLPHIWRTIPVSSLTPNLTPLPPIFGNGDSLPITHTGDVSFPTSSFPIHLRNVVITLNLIKNLISVCRLTRENPIIVEFDMFGFSVKDLLTRRVILRCDSPDDLYPLVSGPQALLAEISDLWHQRLGHPGHAALSKTLSSFKFSCNKAMSTTCHACRLGKHVRLPFKQSDSQASFPFALMHCDVWTSPIKSVSG